MADATKFDNVGDSVKNILWGYASFFCTKVLNLVAIIILAWYLDPAEFGLMAICLAAMGFLEIISQFGMGAALITARDNIEATASAVLVCGVAISITLVGAVWLAAEPIANWYGDPMLAELLPLIAFGLVIRAVTTVNGSFLYKELRLKAKMLPDIARSLAKALFAIVLAVLGYGVWALVIGFLAGSVAQTIVTWIVRPWRPTRRPDAASIKFVLRYGAHLFGATAVNATPRLLDNILVGKVLGMSALGVYSLAFRVPELGIKTFSYVAGSVLHPVMSRIQSEPEQLKEYYYGSLKYSALLMFGCGAAIAILAEPLIHVLYAPKWYGMIVPMQLLAVAFAISTINMAPGSVFKALSRTDLLFKVSLINLPFFVVLIWLAVPYGIEAVALIQVVLAVIRFVPNYIMLRRALDVNARDTFGALAPGLLCAAAASVASLLVLQLDFPNTITALLAGASVFTLVHLVSMRIVTPEVYRELSRRFLRTARA